MSKIKVTREGVEAFLTLNPDLYGRSLMYHADAKFAGITPEQAEMVSSATDGSKT